MNVASLELSKELYELSGWKDTFNSWEYSDGIPAGEPYLTQPELMRRYGLWSTQEVKKQYPAYDLGYLLRKLPEGATVSKFKGGQNFTLPYGCRINFGGNRSNRDLFVKLNKLANTPEDAACLLAIELFKQGVLKNER